MEGRDKNQVAGLELTETFLLCGRAAQKTHIRNIVVFFHPMSQIQVASGKFDAATTEASITRRESELSFLQVKATMTLQERIRQVKGDICENRRQMGAVEIGEHRRSRESIQPHPNIRKRTPSDPKRSHGLCHKVPARRSHASNACELHQ